MRLAMIGAAAVAAVCTAAPSAEAFVFSTAGAGDPDAVTHPIGYSGQTDNVHLSISMGINPGSPHVSEMVTPVKNVIDTWNGLAPTTGNLVPANLPFTMWDFESVLLHEAGHALGLGHPNLGNMAGIDSDDRNFAHSRKGPDDQWDLLPGIDSVDGSADDMRDDDVNLNWFRASNNNPFTIAGDVDASTYSRDLADLPGSDNYSAVGSKEVAAITPGVADNTEAVMVQGSPNGEAQRTLGHDDVAGILYGMSGLDEIAGTDDDYTFELVYAGLTDTADVTVTFEDPNGPDRTSFAVTSFSSTSIAGGHDALTTATIYFDEFAGNDGMTQWFFNPVPEPTTLLLAGGGVFAACRRRRARIA